MSFPRKLTFASGIELARDNLPSGRAHWRFFWAEAALHADLVVERPIFSPSRLASVYAHGRTGSLRFWVVFQAAQPVPNPYISAREFHRAKILPMPNDTSFLLRVCLSQRALAVVHV
jgi:hypothetical protein